MWERMGRVLSHWRDDKLAAGRTTVLARRLDNKSATGRTSARPLARR